jgi:peptidoglycan/xylan/chitin deacetylase (PgdA/CDA1 family)
VTKRPKPLSVDLPWWKELALRLYCEGTMPYRRRLQRRLAAAGQSPAMVLFYHRVADSSPNAWTCPTKTFARQMLWLKKRFDMVSLAEAQRRIRSGDNARPCVSVTFDDGYAENCDFAIPLLVREKIPCTYFVTSRHAIEGLPFPHDLALGQRNPPNTLDQLRAMADHGIEIGSHTRTHPDLGTVTDHEQLYEEVLGAKHELEASLGITVRHFAFPYGLYANLNATAFQMAHDFGYEGVCSAYGGYNFPGDDAFHLQRIHGCPQMARIQNWLSLDPRKLHVPRYEYQTSDAASLQECFH